MSKNQSENLSNENDSQEEEDENSQQEVSQQSGNDDNEEESQNKSEEKKQSNKDDDGDDDDDEEDGDDEDNEDDDEEEDEEEEDEEDEEEDEEDEEEDESEQQTSSYKSSMSGFGDDIASQVQQNSQQSNYSDEITELIYESPKRNIFIFKLSLIFTIYTCFLASTFYLGFEVFQRSTNTNYLQYAYILLIIFILPKIYLTFFWKNNFLHEKYRIYIIVFDFIFSFIYFLQCQPEISLTKKLNIDSIWRYQLVSRVIIAEAFIIHTGYLMYLQNNIWKQYKWYVPVIISAVVSAGQLYYFESQIIYYLVNTKNLTFYLIILGVNIFQVAFVCFNIDLIMTKGSDEYDDNEFLKAFYDIIGGIFYKTWYFFMKETVESKEVEQKPIEHDLFKAEESLFGTNKQKVAFELSLQTRFIL